ncbi:glycosyltransferase family 2 protein [Nodularia sphaerocarpa]|uniref:glycosyltransferase family 2 protein n=1 Tax=Nodularia sphaerocarpa TaxID=137816 RepID=UPI001EFB769C|nr:glycosyltransferase family A protein [Nodularia sphaerocarpa]MDB9372550.1 glycosyltransferase family A protein [Nodularia sphaerocarpa CS-585]MDB9380477.1 glycosyltransferase family A protein [Nodularia sphaerocarpa CS-585A2]ULP73682.1 Chondroitin synthase [Nodularia sphaerocarpa UHCC 0038]
MNNLPLVTVVIPVYNSAKFLAATLDSVFAQTYRPIEVIVVDDGSTDNSADIVRSYPEVQYFYQSNQGVSVARNVAIAAAKAELIAFLDSDDLWKPDKLSLQIAYMLENTHIGITGTKAINFLESDTQLPPWLRDHPCWEQDRVIIPSTMVVHKSVFSQVGDFSPDYRASQDIEWLWRAKDAKIPMLKINEILTLRRFHGSNVSWLMAGTHKSRMLRIIKDSIARQSRQPQ